MVKPRQQSTVNGQREPPEQLLALARAVLDSVMDPEVPVLSIVELGIVRQVELVPDPDTVRVTLTPTYSGCPAMHAIEAEIRSALLAAGLASVELKTVYAPAWTTDWISSPAREKLRAYGIAPPPPAPSVPPAPGAAGNELVPLGRARWQVACPFCGSPKTALVSEFGATACKSLHFCPACRQPFEHFKSF